MNRRHLMLASAAIALTACGRTRESTPAAAQAGASALPALTVHKNVGCGCCDLWVKHMQAAGFVAEVREEPNMGPIKERVGVPVAMGSCHTAEVAGYFLEGHVPAEDALRLLRERPDARGLTVPGMPLGSPGMEVEGHSDAYDVFLVAKDGSTSVYAHHGP